jgi:hypothetical protein
VSYKRLEKARFKWPTINLQSPSRHRGTARDHTAATLAENAAMNTVVPAAVG